MTRGGFVYHSGTAKGFQKMRKQGIPMPSIKVIDEITRMISRLYEKDFNNFRKEINDNIWRYSVKKIKGSLVKDEIYSLINYLDTINNNGLMGRSAEQEEDYQKLLKKLTYQMQFAEEHFFDNLFQNSDQRFANILINFSLNKNDVFNDRLDGLHKLYIDNSLERIAGGQDDLKSRFIKRLTDWAVGESRELDVNELIDEMKKTSVSEARFFARDQILRFNRALMLTTYDQAEVKKVIWHTVEDGAVRPTHRKLNKQVFNINNLPDEINDYNCRCWQEPIFEDEVYNQYAEIPKYTSSKFTMRLPKGVL